MSQTVCIVWKHILSQIVSVRPICEIYFLSSKNIQNYREYRLAHATVYLNEAPTGHSWPAEQAKRWRIFIHGWAHTYRAIVGPSNSDILDGDGDVRARKCVRASVCVCVCPLYVLKNVIQYYRNYNSPVYTCFLDASKAHDRVNHWREHKRSRSCIKCCSTGWNNISMLICNICGRF